LTSYGDMRRQGVLSLEDVARVYDLKGSVLYDAENQTPSPTGKEGPLNSLGDLDFIISSEGAGMADLAMVLKKDLLKAISEKAGMMGLIGLSIGLSVRGYELDDAVSNFDEELGAYVIPDDVMDVLGCIGGMEGGQAFNLLGNIGIKVSTFAAIKVGSQDALYELRHEQSHNKYREAHPAELPYKSIEQTLIDEVYAHFAGFISTYGRDKLFEKRALRWGEMDWFENVLNLLVNDYVGKDVEQRAFIVKKLSYAISIIKLAFKDNQDSKIMDFILKANNLDEILGITPLEHQQWLIDGAVQPVNHSEIRERWIQFKPDSAMGASKLQHFEKGGIDLNSANLNLLIKRDGKGVPLPIDKQDMEQLKGIRGFVPVILGIRPVINLPIVNELQQKLQSNPSVVS
ncbi:MAG: hypothetical protein HQL13_04575, partial [Candidatus Omnitrophica bacterium]|nr:hypothetical protein [Candidatus Omnitrophota bacterium]